MLLCLACSKEPSVQLVDFSNSGCERETKAEDYNTVDTTPVLILEYSQSGLVLTRSNTYLNCSINNGGIACDVSLDGDTIHFSAYEADGPVLRCMCFVKTISATIGGLSTGRHYTLDYSCGDDFSPISFTYEKDMKLVIDLSLYHIYK